MGRAVRCGPCIFVSPYPSTSAHGHVHQPGPEPDPPRSHPSSASVTFPRAQVSRLLTMEYPGKGRGTVIPPSVICPWYSFKFRFQRCHPAFSLLIDSDGQQMLETVSHARVHGCLSNFLLSWRCHIGPWRIHLGCTLQIP